ncbi:nucleotide exchange factor GrpE [Candidatus Saccharibacteria bacterium]|nr:nucleotide exchange factor GrpE [Candidatus Saccharibacteria bacterium]
MRKKLSITQLQKQIDELTQALQRERADSVNLRRRVDEEREQLGGFYKAMVVRQLLPAIDNLERAMMHTPKDLKNHDYVKGVQGVVKQFEQSFKQLGVERIKTVGQEFDPRYHEAISVEDPSPGSGQAHELVEVVSEELQPGYKLGDEIIRHATVKVRMEKVKEE